MAALTTKERKRDAHQKIQLGGLVVKAGMRGVDPAIILGALINTHELMKQGDTATIAAFRRAGIQALKAR